MKDYNLTKDLIFYSPNKSDSLLTMKAGTPINLDVLNDTKHDLETKTHTEVKWTKERRKTRPSANV